MSTYKDKYIKYKKKYIDLKNKISGGSDNSEDDDSGSEDDDSGSESFDFSGSDIWYDSDFFTDEMIALNVSEWMFEKAGMEVKEPTFLKFKEAVMKISDLYEFKEEKKIIIAMFNGVSQEPSYPVWARLALKLGEKFLLWGYMTLYTLKKILGKHEYNVILSRLRFTNEVIALNVSEWMFEKARMEVKEPTFVKFKEASVRLYDLYEFDENRKKSLMSRFDEVSEDPGYEVWGDMAWRTGERFWVWGVMTHSKLKELVGYYQYDYIMSLVFGEDSEDYQYFISI